MEIVIAGEHLKLSVPFSDQDMVRDTEKEIGELYDSWRRRFPAKSVDELLAMMVYQYASRYHLMITERESLEKSLSEMVRFSAKTLKGDKDPEKGIRDKGLNEFELLSDPDSPL